MAVPLFLWCSIILYHLATTYRSKGYGLAKRVRASNVMYPRLDAIVATVITITIIALP